MSNVQSRRVGSAAGSSRRMFFAVLGATLTLNVAATYIVALSVDAGFGSVLTWVFAIVFAASSLVVGAACLRAGNRPLGHPLVVASLVAVPLEAVLAAVLGFFVFMFFLGA